MLNQSKREIVWKKVTPRRLNLLVQHPKKFDNQLLVIENSLDLSGITTLTSLPKHLYLEGDLNLSNCTGLTTLPESLAVMGNMVLQGCTGLITLSS